MAENSKIAWTDHSVNFWIGCEKVSPACANCYAETWNRRFHPAMAENVKLGVGKHWGSHAPRLIRVEKAIQEALRYEKRAVKEGRRFRVFTNSMADFFEDRRDLDPARLGALDVIRHTPHLDWLILTKRPEKIIDLLNRAWALPSVFIRTDLRAWLHRWECGDPPANVALGTTVESQEFAAPRLDALLRVPARTHFASVEPMLGPVNLSYWLDPLPAVVDQRARLGWVICGGESGHHARSMHPEWARSLRDQCAAAGVPFLFKQWGEHAPNWLNDDEGRKIPGSEWIDRMGKKAAGRLLDGVEHSAFPEVAHV